MNNESKRLWYEYRIQVLTARDPVGNANIINKLKRKLRNLERENKISQLLQPNNTYEWKDNH